MREKFTTRTSLGGTFRAREGSLLWVRDEKKIARVNLAMKSSFRKVISASEVSAEFYMNIDRRACKGIAVKRAKIYLYGNGGFSTL